MKLLAWAILILAVIWVLRSKAKARTRAQEAVRPAAPPTPASLPETEAMVSCVQCGIHFPASEAVHDEASHQTFCSIEHRQLYSGR